MAEPRFAARLVFSARLLGWGVVLAAASHVAAFLAVACIRLRYPFELEWLEGGTLEQVRGLLESRKLYAAPSLGAVATFYAPLYFYVAAVVAHLAGLSLQSLRLTSILASLGSVAVLFAFVRRESGSVRAGALAAGLFVGSFRATGAWLDLARIDALFLFLMLAAAYWIRFGRSGAAHAMAGVLMALAFHTKQTALVAGLCLGVFYLRWQRRRAAHFLVAWLLVGVGGSFALEAAHAGWYRFYVFELPAGHSLVARVSVLFWTRDLFGPMAVATLLGTFWLGERWLSAGEGRQYYAALATALVGTSYLSRANIGAYDNVLLPAYALLATLFALGAHRAVELTQALASPARSALQALVHLGCLIQFGALAYNPLAQLPTAKDREAGEALVARLRALPGEVFLPGHPYLLERAGKPVHAHFLQIADVLWHGRGKSREGLEAELRKALEARRFSALILDSRRWFPGIENCYRESGPIFEDDSAFYPVTGARLRPAVLYLPREVAECRIPDAAFQ